MLKSLLRVWVLYLPDTIELLYQNGVKHVGYYPDDPIADHPNPTMLKKVFAQK